jgi:hypothetical protein
VDAGSGDARRVAYDERAVSVRKGETAASAANFARRDNEHRLWWS